MSFTPYQKKSPGDVLKLQDWLAIQRRIKEELRDHRHLGDDHDGDIVPDQIGPVIGAGSFAANAITPPKLADGAVGEVSLQDGAIGGEHFDRDNRLPERYIRFDSAKGHNHDGESSRALPPGVVGTSQLRDDSVSEQQLHILPKDVELTAGEETYARGRAFTPGNVLRAARELIEHVGMTTQTLLYPEGYLAIARRQLIIKGFELNELLDEADGKFASQFIYVEFTFSSTPSQTLYAEAQILDERMLVTVVPDVGLGPQTGYLRVVRGAGEVNRPYQPQTNGVPFNYEAS